MSLYETPAHEGLERDEKKHIWGFPEMGVPQNGWFIGKIPLKWMMTGGTPIIYGKPYIWIHTMGVYLKSTPYPLLGGLA